MFLKLNDRNGFFEECVRNKVAVLLALMLILAVAFLGCTWVKSMTIPATPEGKYLAARVGFNKSVATYEEYYQAASEETQAKWKAEIDPFVLSGFTALDGWKLARVEGTPTAEWEREFLSLKRKLVNLLFLYKIK